MTTQPPCVGRSWLFESIHPADHLEAREYCLECPMRKECDDLRDRWSVGTWAGRLYGAPANAMRMLREDEVFTDDDARDAHARFYHGQRDRKTRVGERVYQRRSARLKKMGRVA